MPCYTIRNMEVDVGRLNRDIALAAFKASAGNYGHVLLENNTIRFDAHAKFGYGTLDLQTGTLTHNAGLSTSEAKSELMRAYSRASVLETAKRNRWQVKETSPNKFQVTRRF